MRAYRIITDGKRFRAQVRGSEWVDCIHKRFYPYQWIARLVVWNEKRHERYVLRCEAKERAEKHAIWEKVE